jgi:hypothetical protein
MSLTESMLEAAAHGWFEYLGYAVGPAPVGPRRTGGGAGFVLRCGAGRPAARGHPAAEQGHSTASPFLPARHAAAEAAERRVERELTHHRIAQIKANHP